MSVYSRLDYFVRRSPRPSHLRTDTGERIAVATSGSWVRDTRRAVEAVGWSRLEALDSSGAVLRVIENDDEEEQEEAPTAPPAESLFAIAELLERAADKAAARHEAAYAMAFQRYGELVQMLTTRMAGVESAWAKAMSDRANMQMELAQQAAEKGGDGLDGLIGSMLGGVVSEKKNGGPA